MVTSNASAVWEGGGLKSGTGRYEGKSGFAGQYSAATRFEGKPGSTPEELIAAAHAACYSMALSVALEKNGTPPRRVETQAACSIDKVGAGFKITTMKLTTRADVPGIDEATFRTMAEGAKEGCPVSGALKGNVDIQLDASLTGG